MYTSDLLFIITCVYIYSSIIIRSRRGTGDCCCRSRIKCAMYPCNPHFNKSFSSMVLRYMELYKRPSANP